MSLTGYFRGMDDERISGDGMGAAVRRVAGFAPGLFLTGSITAVGYVLAGLPGLCWSAGTEGLLHGGELQELPV
jgi:hypothetical protein